MKLKQDPDDFQVEELTDLQVGPHGPFAFYRLQKRGWTTPDAIGAIRHRWKLPSSRIAWGGLKDRHATTTQYISIWRGPQRNFGQPGIDLTYLGQRHEPYSSRAIRGNRFQITVRNLAEDPLNFALTAVDYVRVEGLPNYFDDQRFGSVGAGGDFIARRMVRGEFEQALRLALAGPYEHDRAAVRREKEVLIEYWGRWVECKSKLERGHARSLVDYLCHHETDFRGAVGRLRPELQGLYLSAYQSYLWNAILSGWISESFSSDDLISLELRSQALPAPRQLTDAQRTIWRQARLPLPAARTRFDPASPWAGIAERVLADEGLTWQELKIRGLRKPFFTRGDRAAWCVPEDLTADAENDVRHPGRMALRLRFILPRGSYATLLIKRLFVLAPDRPSVDQFE